MTFEEMKSVLDDLAHEYMRCASKCADEGYREGERKWIYRVQGIWDAMERLENQFS